MLKIVETPAEVLITPSKPVEVFDTSLQSLLTNMEETLVAQSDPEGVGLAAPQVGINKAIFIMKPTPDAPLEVCINPKIIKSEPIKTTPPKPLKKNTPLEGCLSIPHIWSPVKRSRRVRLEYQDVTGKRLTKWYTGFKAVIVQHEVDHLHGVLFTQRALEQQTTLYKEKKGKLVKFEI